MYYADICSSFDVLYCGAFAKSSIILEEKDYIKGKITIYIHICTFIQLNLFQEINISKQVYHCENKIQYIENNIELL